MFENGYILRLGKDLVARNTATVGFTLEIADNTVGKSFFLVIGADGDISHDTAAERSGTNQTVIIKKSHRIINVSGKSEIKFF